LSLFFVWFLKKMSDSMQEFQVQKHLFLNSAREWGHSQKWLRDYSRTKKCQTVVGGASNSWYPSTVSMYGTPYLYDTVRNESNHLLFFIWVWYK
jgi:hypothetical protein